MCCCAKRYFLQTLLSIIVVTSVTGLSLEECEGGWFPTSEEGGSVLTCTGVGSSATVTWQFEPTAENILELGTCPPQQSSCNMTLTIATGSRPASDRSQLTFSPFGNRYQAAGSAVYCRTQTDNSDRQQCLLHLVFYPSSVACTAQFNTDASPWTVSGSCDVTKIYSSRDQYTCQWRQSGGGSPEVINTTTMTTSPNQDSSYKDGRCTMVGQLPASDGTYTYTVMTSPGSAPVTAVFTGSSVVHTPSTPSITGCVSSTYIPELSRLECTCSTDDVGIPAGRVQWSPASPPQGVDSSRLVLANVSRGDNGREYQCQVRWNRQTLQSQSSYTVHVAYGPYQDRVSITSSDLTNNVFDTDGSRDLHVTCQYTAVSPTPDITWLDPASCRGQGHTCTFRPQPPSDVTVRCQVTNSQNNGKTQNVSRTVVLNYPPTSPPQITGYTAGTPLCMGAPLTLTCDVTGGEPAVTSVNLTCPNHPSSVTPGTRSRLEVTSLIANDHNTTCTCRAQWKVPSLYSSVQGLSLTVHSPPSNLSITRQSAALYPYMEGDRPTLRCSSSERGVPSATYTWSGRRPGDTVTPSAGGSQLDMATLTSTDNGNTINCTASNNFTINCGQAVTTSHVLDVYYKPLMETEPSSDNTCSFRSDRHPADPDLLTCVVREGRPVKVNCIAVSNPVLVDIGWTQQGGGGGGSSGGGGDGSGGGQLAIGSADRDRDNTEWTCVARTVNTNPPDSRLPLSSNKTLRIYVAYPSQVVNVTLNSAADTLTVNESDVTSVTLSCQSDGRPTPHMELVREYDDVTLNSVTGGMYVFQDVTSDVNHVISRATCDDTGSYKCVTDNQQGDVSQQSVSLFVNCQPMLSQTIPDTYLNYNGRPVSLTVPLKSFPPPSEHSVTYMGPLSNSTQHSPARAALYHVHCQQDATRVFLSVCTVTMDNATEGDKGFYDVAFFNHQGQEVVRLELDVNGTTGSGDQDTQSGASIGAAVGGGVAAAVAVIAVVVVVVLVKRRRQKTAKENGMNNTRSTNRGRQSDEEEPEMIINSIYDSSGPRNHEDDDGTMIVNTMYESSGPVGVNASAAPKGSAYEDVELHGAGPSVSPQSQGAAAASPAAASATAAASDSQSLYSTVNKSNKSGPANPTTAGTVDPSLYATVVPKSKTPASKPAKASKPEVQTKPNKKGKQIQPKGKKTDKKKEKTGDNEPLRGADSSTGVYGNTDPRSMTANPVEGTEYENFGFQDENGETRTGNQTPSASSDSHTVNPDGLLYTTIAFTEEQLKKGEKPPPDRETTEYADLDFVHLASQSKK